MSVSIELASQCACRPEVERYVPAFGVKFVTFRSPVGGGDFLFPPLRNAPFIIIFFLKRHAGRVECHFDSFHLFLPIPFEDIFFFSAQSFISSSSI